MSEQKGLGRAPMNILWWQCPYCQSKVNYSYQLMTLFDRQNGEAEFCTESGVPFHTIKCENETCEARWIMGISSVIPAVSVVESEK